MCPVVAVVAAAVVVKTMPKVVSKYKNGKNNGTKMMTIPIMTMTTMTTMVDVIMRTISIMSVEMTV